MNICQQLGACAYDVVEGGDTSEPCQWWSDCFGQSNPLPFTMGTTDTERCPTCKSVHRWIRLLGEWFHPGHDAIVQCPDPWHRPAPLVEGEQTDA